jgi:hypothetical protein
LSYYLLVVVCIYDPGVCTFARIGAHTLPVYSMHGLVMKYPLWQYVSLLRDTLLRLAVAPGRRHF